MLLLDKTGTITLGNRIGHRVYSRARAFPMERLASAAQLASLADETPEGRSIVVLAKEKFGLRARDASHAHFVPFSAQTRMSGVDLTGDGTAKPAAASARGPRQASSAGSRRRAASYRRPWRQPWMKFPARAARRWSWRKDREIVGTIHLKDIVKGGIKERFAQLRAHGHPHRHDHGRQSPHRRRHRGGGGRGRFPRPGHAGNETQPHPRGAEPPGASSP